METILDEPRISIQNNLITDEECEHFITVGKLNNMQQSKVSGQKSGLHSAGRTGKTCWIQHGYDETTLRVAERISKIVNIPLENAEAFQIIYYGVTEEYRTHYDCWLHDNSEKSNRVMKRGGQRLITALCYLNTVESGGGTRMTRADINITAKQGKILIFSNCYKDTNIRHPLSEHAGMPVLRGHKWHSICGFASPQCIRFITRYLMAIQKVPQYLHINLCMHPI